MIPGPYKEFLGRMRLSAKAYWKLYYSIPLDFLFNEELSVHSGVGKEGCT